MTFEVFVWLMIFAHFVGDFAFKSSYIAANKGREWYYMLAHCILYTGVVGWVLLGWTNPFNFPYFGLLLLLGSHWIIDVWKCRKIEKLKAKEGSRSWKACLYMDQLAHFIVLAGLIIWYK